MCSNLLWGIGLIAVVAVAASYVWSRPPRYRLVDVARVKYTPKNATTEIVDARSLSWQGETLVICGLGAGDSELHLNILDAPFAATVLEILERDVPWCEMAHRGGIVPRLVAIQAEANAAGWIPVYRHPADSQPRTTPFHDVVRGVARRAELAIDGRKYGCSLVLNHCLLQWYRSGADYISEHSDKTLDVKRGTPILNVSLGATRVLTLRAKRHPDMPKGSRDRPGPARPAQRIYLPHNSMFVLGSKTNREFTHMVSRDGRPAMEKSADETCNAGSRISLTLRQVATFKHAGVLHGQGGTVPPRPPAPRGTPEYESEVTKMIAAFSAENRELDFDWDRHYGRGFATLGFDVLE